MRFLKGGLLGALLFISAQSFSQTGISLYHLGDKTIQINQYNPAWQAEGTFNLALPGISKIDVNVNNAFSFNDVLTKQPNGNYRLNNKVLFEKAEDGTLNVDVNKLTLLQTGFKLPSKNIGFTIFSNLTSNTQFAYSKELFQLMFNGNASAQQFSIERIGGTSVSYIDMGAGVQKSFLKNKLKVGANLKYLMGVAYAESNKKLNINVTTNPDNYELIMDVRNFSYQYSYPEEEFEPFKHSGFAIDLGATYSVMDKLNVSFAVTDIGAINWKEVTNEAMADQTVTFSGVDYSDENSDFEDEFADKFKTSVGAPSDVKTNLPTRYLLSAQYQLSKNNIFTATSISVNTPAATQSYFGIGYTRKAGKYFALSLNGVKWPGQSLGFGIGTALNLGAAQLYLASDNVGRWNVSKSKAADFKFGLNFTFGRGQKKEKKVAPQIGNPRQ